MTLFRPVLHRTGLGVIAGAMAGGLAAVQGMDGWPLVRTVAVVLTPVPLVLATVRGGVAAAVAGLGVATVAVGAGAAGTEVPGWAFLVGYGGVVVYVLYVARHLQNLNTVAWAGLGLAAGLALLELSVRAGQEGHTLSEAYGTLMVEIETELTTAPALQDMDADTREQMMAALPLVQRLFPGFAVLQFAASIAISCGACLVALRRLGLREVQPLGFAKWRLPDWFVLVFILPAAGLLLGIWQGWPGLTTVTANVLVVVASIYLLQGAAIMHALLRRLQAHPALEAVAFVGGFLLFGAMLLMLLAVAGLFDFLVDFRGRWTPASPAPGERPDS